MRPCRSGPVFFAACAGLLALLIAVGAARAEKRVALVIGNDVYPNLPADRQLEKAVNDARAVGAALERLGYTVVRGENLDRRGMVDRLFDFTKKIEPGDMAVVFYAGHGVAISGGNYLLPTDMPMPKAGEEPRVRNMAIGEADIISELQERAARVAVLIIDACRDNPFRQPGLLRSVGGTRGLTRVQEAEGVFAIYSAGFGQTALDRLGDGDASPNSVFTRVLVPALTQRGKHLGDLVIDVREKVAKLAARIGHQQYPAYYDQTRGGRVYLAPGAAAAPAAQTAPPTPPLDRPKPDAGGGFVTSLLQQFFGGDTEQPAGNKDAPTSAKTPGPVAALPPAPESPPKPARPPVAEAIEIGPQEPRDPTPATECDRLATRNRQWEKAPGIAGHAAAVTIHTYKAATACRAALEQYPESRRIRFLLAESLTGPSTRSERKALLTESVRRGSLDAAVALGSFSISRFALPRDGSLAMRLYEEAGRRGYGEGYCRIGEVYSVTLDDMVEGRRWYEKGVALGYGRALRSLGNFYARGSGGLAKDSDEARRLYLKAVQAGTIEAYWDLGWLGRDEASPAGTARARDWFLKGVEAGDPQSALGLADLYEYDDEKRGMKRNVVEMKRWYEHSVSLGNVYALVDLAHIAVLKDNPERSEAKALALLDRLRALVPGVLWPYRFVYIWSDSYVADPAKAFNRILKAAEADPSNGSNAQLAAQWYEKGRGVEKNLDLARRWYERAAAAGDFFAWDLGRFYMKGLGGLPVDAAGAAEWMLTALTAGYYTAKVELIDKKGVDLEPDVVLAIQGKLKGLGFDAVARSGIVDTATLATLKRLYNPLETGFTRAQIAAAR